MYLWSQILTNLYHKHASCHFFLAKKWGKKTRKLVFFLQRIVKKDVLVRKKIIIFAELLRREVGSAEEQPAKRQNIAFIHKKKHLFSGAFFIILW